jgi:hypothetical protein
VLFSEMIYLQPFWTYSKKARISNLKQSFSQVQLQSKALTTKVFSASLHGTHRGLWKTAKEFITFSIRGLKTAIG